MRRRTQGCLKRRSIIPLSQEQASLLAQLTGGLDRTGLWWLSGYAAGLAHGQPQPTRLMALPAAEAHAAQPLTIVYGSQTGNAKRVAESLPESKKKINERQLIGLFLFFSGAPGKICTPHHQFGAA